MSLFPLPVTVTRSTRTLVSGVWQKTTTTLTIKADVQPASQANGGLAITSTEPGRRDVGTVVIYTTSTLVAPREGTTTSPDVITWMGSLWEITYQQPHQGQLIQHNKYLAEYRGQAT